MTSSEKAIAEALGRCSFLPGHADKKFANQLPNWSDRPMTAKGRAYMIRLVQKYRRQIPNWQKLIENVNF